MRFIKLLLVFSLLLSPSAFADDAQDVYLKNKQADKDVHLRINKGGTQKNALTAQGSTGRVLTTGGVIITGSSDESQLTVKSNATQTTDTMQIQDSTGTAMIELENSGVVRNSSTIIGGSAGAAQGELRITSSTQTIATGVITGAYSNIRIDTQAAAATDDLDTINGCTEGDTIVLRAFSAARTVVIKDGTGNIQTDGSADFSMDNDTDTWMGICFNSQWIEISRANNGT